MRTTFDKTTASFGWDTAKSAHVSGRMHIVRGMHAGTVPCRSDERGAFVYARQQLRQAMLLQLLDFLACQCLAAGIVIPQGRRGRADIIFGNQALG
jgi:hypothetical protein